MKATSYIRQGIARSIHHNGLTEYRRVRSHLDHHHHHQKSKNVLSSFPAIARSRLTSRKTCTVVASQLPESAEKIIAKYMGVTNNTLEDTRRRRSSTMGNGVFTLLAINFALHFASYFWHPAWMAALPLSHWAPKWWQFITAAFVHASWEHLLGNAFSLLIFGRMVEEEEGSFGVWMTYVICGLGGNLASYATSPGTRAIALGASSAVFGLFIVGVVTKLKPSIRRLMEAVILGSFAFKQVAQEVALVMGNASSSKVIAGGMSIGHAAHLGGAAAGVLLIVLLSRLGDY